VTTVVPRAARRFWPTLESVLVADFERSGGLLGLMGATGAASSSSSSYGIAAAAATYRAAER